MTAQPNQLADEYLLFRIDRQEYAVLSHWVLETVRLPRLIALQATPDWVIGGFDLRGRMVTVISLAVLLGHPPMTARTDQQLVVLELGSHLLGLHIDEALSVEIAQLVMPLAKDGSAGGTALITEEFEAGETICPIIAPQRLSVELPPNQAPSDATERLRAFESALDEAGRQLLDRRTEGFRATGRDQAEDTLHPFMLVRIAGEPYVLPAAEVMEVSRAGSPVPLPTAPRHVIGLVNQRGTLLPLLDIRAALGLASTQLWEPENMLVVKYRGHDTGVAVDEVHDVIDAQVSTASPATAHRGMVAAWMTGSIRFADQTVPILDLATLFSDAGLVVDQKRAGASSIPSSANHRRPQS